MYSNRIRILPLLILLISLILIAGCGRQSTPVSVSPTPSVTPSPVVTQAPSNDNGSAVNIPGMAAVSTVDSAPTRTPEPTATPDAITEMAESLAQETGLDDASFLGLSIVDWFNLGGSLLLVLTTYLVGTWIIRWLLPRITARTKSKIDGHILEAAGVYLRWILVVFSLRIATTRLVFIGARFQTILGDVYFILFMLLSIAILLRLINFLAAQLDIQARKAGHKRQAKSLILLVVWGLRLIVFIFALPIVLNHFGIDVTGFAVLVGIVALTISLAGRDVLADIIAGILILTDMPFRVGDRVGLGDIDMWGDVVDIGMLSTKILTIDNRTVFIPNSKVRQGEIVNYSIPDPSLYDTTNIGVAYDNDVEKVEQLLIKAALSVDGVDKERGNYTRLESFTRDEMIFTIGWWMKDNDDYYTLRQLVNRAIVKTLKEAGVTFPYIKHVDLDPKTDKIERPEKPDQDQ